MPKMQLKRPGFTYSACGPFTKNKERNSKIYEDRKYKLYSQKQSWQSFFSTWYG